MGGSMQSLKSCFDDGDNHPMKIRQSCYHHKGDLKAERWIY